MAPPAHHPRPDAALLLPRPPGGIGAGVAVSLGVHAVLLAALAGVVQWRTQSPVVAAAELWASVPETAAAPPSVPVPVHAPAPAPVPPTPAPAPPPSPTVAAPKPPDIATEQAAREQKERGQKERELKEREQKERQRRERERSAEQERQQAETTERARQEQLRRMMQAAGTAGSSPAGTAARDAAPSASYVARLAALIRGNSVYGGEAGSNAAAEVEVRTTAGGAILSRRLVKSSGNPAWDDAVLRAIDRTGKLPPDTDGRVPTSLIIAFRPKE